MYLAENRVPLRNGDKSTAISVMEARGSDPMSVDFAAKICSLETCEALRRCMRDEEVGEVLRLEMEMAEIFMRPVAYYNIACDKRGVSLDNRSRLLNIFLESLSRNICTGAHLDIARAGEYVHGISKITTETAAVCVNGAHLVMQLSAKMGAEAAAWVNMRALNNDACEQHFSTSQNKTAVDFIKSVDIYSKELEKRLCAKTPFYYPGNSITRGGKRSRSDFNDESAQHEDALVRSLDDDSTSKGSKPIREKSRVKVVK